MKRLLLLGMVLLLLVACGTTVKTYQGIPPAPPAKKTVTLTLHQGEQLELGGYSVAVQRIAADTVDLTINGQAISVTEGKTATLAGSAIEVSISSDSTGQVAQIRITER